MSKKLLIVESPAKAKTIEKYLGEDFQVRSSFGHICDLEKGKGGIDIKNNFKPSYVVSPEKLRVVAELKSLAKHASEVWLATDEDREGEAISWHLCNVLGLNERTTKRIVFHEITKPAITAAVQNPRFLDLDLVNAQQARRVLDRLVGFELSETLWRKVKNQLSAGRVQSVAVKLVVERERDIQNFKVTPFYKVDALFKVPNEQGKVVDLYAELPKRYDEAQDAENFLKKCIGAKFSIENIEVKPLKRSPAAPFTTSTLQQEASRKLGFSVTRTMSTAQHLYEQGFITYMRTDSTTLSATALQSIAAEIETSYGKKYVHTRQYKSKQANAQEAHEAIRPTYIENKTVVAERDAQRLYELIWKRAIASQMADAELEKTIVKIGISTIGDAKLQAEGEVLKFDGFLKVYLEGKDDDDEEAKGVLPPLKVGQLLNMDKMHATERFTKPAPRFSEASLVKKLEELGIGRPSTYAPTISKIMEPGRGYVIKDTRDGVERNYTQLTLKGSVISKAILSEKVGAAKNQLFATDTGMVVVDFLDEHFKEVMNYGFTAEVENQLDVIANGGQEWQKMIKNFYEPFHETVEKTIQTANRATGERVLGAHPDHGKTVIVRLARFGPVVQIGNADELDADEKPAYANLAANQNMETITLEEALNLFQLPRTVGKYTDGTELIVNVGRFGPYIKYKEIFVSLLKGEDPMSVTLERATELVSDKLLADAPVGQFDGKPIGKGKGKFGPFLKWDTYFINVPARYNFDSLSLAEMHELIKGKINKEDNRYLVRFEDLKIDIENGRWGPFIKFGKENITLKHADGKRMTNEEATSLTVAEAKAMVEAAVPGAFEKKVVVKKAKK
jgi:DNA topoisomerase I